MVFGAWNFMILTMQLDFINSVNSCLNNQYLPPVPRELIFNNLLVIVALQFRVFLGAPQQTLNKYLALVSNESDDVR